ncbi:hypothetical protein AYK59_19205 [Pseudomonas synxantha]|uniref:hypothetical protein n=1 Tax=Pseudomonas synxantha TaxID=47883 RepID=UPI00078D045C|nr:hypothetical protein [Pseudomonas synxantha]AMS22156.1 hypothetical protein AYK59_19205 [Pseudomonas synxantha]
MSQVKESPILFSAPMVRAILESRKTVTRRTVKATKAHADGFIMLDHGKGWRPYNAFGDFTSDHEGMEYPIACPYGKPGDRLWVRETFGLQVRHYGGGAGEHIVYRATNPDAIYCKSAEGQEYPVKWKPSIHMPRHSSRILLKITDVRVERLQDITEDQATAEGVCASAVESFKAAGVERPAGFAFRDIWTSINGDEGWPSNPWVWVVEFKRV